MKKILITQPVPVECLELYEGRYEFTVPEKPYTYDEVLEQIADYDAYFIINNKGDKQVIDSGIKLKAVANLGVGYDNIDWKYATEKGIAVVNTPIQVTDATAEMATTLIASTMRGVARYDKEVRRGIWNSPVFSDLNSELTRRTLGILGFGRIGKAVCKKAQGLGMKVIYYDKLRASKEVEEAYGVTYMKWDEVLKVSDCVSLHMPYIPENYHLFNADTFAKMKTGAYLVNAARGPIVDEEALADALESSKLRGAGLDVFEFEPKVNPRLLKLDNVTLTPHVASCTLKTRIGMCEEALSGLIKVLDGKIPDNVVNPEVLQ